MSSGKYQKKKKTPGFRLKLPKFLLHTMSAHADNFIHHKSIFMAALKTTGYKNCRQGALIYSNRMCISK